LADLYSAIKNKIPSEKYYELKDSILDDIVKFKTE
jgi:hypothetical protein